MATHNPPEKHNESTLTASLKSKPSKALTILYTDLAPWQRDNIHIRSGYRPASNSYRTSLASLTHLHNETVNIYTHLVGALLALTAGLYAYAAMWSRYGMATKQDVGVFGCFFGGAMGCLGMSAAYHTISNHSDLVSGWGNKLDYLGIILLIWGSFIPSIYYGFAEDMEWVGIYWSMITTIGAGTMVVVLFPRFRTPTWRPFRAFMFVAMGLSALFPVFHGIATFGIARMERQMSLSWLFTQGALYILGAGIYAARIPERLAPGSFDIWGSSHQIFHVLVVMAAGAHLVGLVKAFDYAHSMRSLVD